MPSFLSVSYMSTGITQWELTVNVDAGSESERDPVSKHQTQPDFEE